MRDGLILAAIGWICATSAYAGENCTCRGSDGAPFQLGDVACIRTSAGPKLAQCVMALNNTSWKVTSESCPTANFTSVAKPPTMLIASGGDDLNGFGGR